MNVVYWLGVVCLATTTHCVCVLYHPHMQIEYPVFWSVEEFCDAFLRLIDHLELDKVSFEHWSCSVEMYMYAYIQCVPVQSVIGIIHYSNTCGN